MAVEAIVMPFARHDRTFISRAERTLSSSGTLYFIPTLQLSFPGWARKNPAHPIAPILSAEADQSPYENMTQRDAPRLVPMHTPRRSISFT